MRILATININGFLNQNSRDSFRDAAERWHCKYVEVSSGLDGFHPTYTKIALLKQYENCERIMYIDADCVIRSDAPNPFSIFADSRLFYAVRDAPARLKIHHDLLDWHASILARLDEIFGPAELPLSPLRCFNAGVFICSPRKHARLIEQVSTWLPVDKVMRTNPVYEQGLFNYVIQRFWPELVCYVDETWNYLRPEELPEMTKYVYHFAGMEGRDALTATVDWRNSGKA